MDESERLRLAELERLRLMRLRQTALWQAQAQAQAATNARADRPLEAPAPADEAARDTPTLASALGLGAHAPESHLRSRKAALRARNPEAAEALVQLEALYAARVPADDARVIQGRQKLLQALRQEAAAEAGAPTGGPLAALSALLQAQQPCEVSSSNEPEARAVSQAEPRKLGTGQLFQITL